MQKPTDASLKLFVRRKDTTPTISGAFFVVPYDVAENLINRLNNVSLPANSCVKYIDMHMEQQIVKDWSIRCRRNNTTITEMPTPTLTIFVETDNWKYGCKSVGGCRSCLASGKCCDKFAIEHIARTFWPDKYTQKTR